MKFEMQKETAEAIEKRELVAKLLERRYGPFDGAGGAGRILFEQSLRDQSIEVLRSMEKFAMERDLRLLRERSERSRP
jgi:hypothetical protein